jgi:hypothetical protein
MSWDLQDPSNRIVATGYDYAPSMSSSYHNETICIDDGRYIFTIHDSASDGMCCGYGIGHYTVLLDEVIVKNGGEFGRTETTNVGEEASTSPSTAPSTSTYSPSTAPSTWNLRLSSMLVIVLGSYIMLNNDALFH